MATKAISDVNRLVDVPVDDVLRTIDVEEETKLPTPQELYDRWERQHWTVQELDLSVDRQQWLSLTEEQAQRRIGTFIGFLHGEVAVTETLHAYAQAMPRQDQRLFITTQIVDEARHVVFFNRMFGEVLGYGKVTGEQILASTKEWLGPSYNHLFDDGLWDISERIKRDPENPSLLTEGVVMYHLLIENILALAFQRSALAAYRKQGFLPGFRAGFTAVTRDESRHVLFGVGFLRDAIKSDPKQADVVMRTLEAWLPTTLDIFSVPPELAPILKEGGIDPEERLAFGKLSLRKKLGILNLPVPTIAAA